MRVAFSRMASNAASKSPGELAIMRRTSAVAACCSSASSRSCVRRAIVSLALATEGLRPRATLDALRPPNVLRRCVLPALPPVLLRRLIASPEALDEASYRVKRVDRKGKPQIVVQRSRSLGTWAKIYGGADPLGEVNRLFIPGARSGFQHVIWDLVQDVFFIFVVGHVIHGIDPRIHGCRSSTMSDNTSRSAALTGPSSHTH